MKNSSTYRVLYLLNLLTKKDLTKNEIINEFSKIKENVSKTSISTYINKLIKNDFKIEILNKKNSNIYHLEPIKSKLTIDSAELKAFNDIKKVLIAQKDYNKIRKFIRILYKFVLHIEDSEKAQKFFDFGYYSKINRTLVDKLKKHCENKDLIEIDYVLTTGKNRKISLWAYDIKIADWSDRMYLWCMFEYSDTLSYLPVDRIYMVNKVKKKNKAFKIKTNVLTYTISKKIYEDSEKDSKEKVIKIEDKYITLQREVDDEFYLIQRLMSFCPDLYYISDNKIKNTVIEKLNQLKSSYERAYE